MIFFCFFATLFLSYDVLCQILFDEIKLLPGIYVTPTFKQYSGYLTGAPNIRIHYWFVESQTNASVDPVVLWLNGGPGCSSLLGFLTGNGPLRVTPDLQLKPNDYSWNKIANMLYFESPAGTGYSYATDGNITTNDDYTAYNNHLALLDFFDKYSKFRSNEFYVTGESYAGVYVPTLSRRLMNDKQINFKGMMIGNGVCHWSFHRDSLLYVLKYRGIIDERTWQEALEKCCPNSTDIICHFSSSTAKPCSVLISKMKSSANGLDHFNMYKPNIVGVLQEKNQIDNFLQKNYASETLQEMLDKENSEYLMYAYVDVTSLTKYMNLPLLRKSIGIKNFLGKWKECSDDLYSHYKIQYKTMAKVYKDVIDQQKHRVWVYNGDFDLACNYLGQQWFLDSLGYPVEKNYTRWTYIGEFNQPQLGGFYIRYSPNITFATIHGSGHMVPTDKPLPAFLLFQAFLQNANL